MRRTRFLKIGVVLGVLVALAGLGAVVGPPEQEARRPAIRPDLSEPDADGKTPLLRAILASEYGTFLDLLKNGADPNTRAWHGTTAVHLAAQHENVRYLEKLLDYGGNPNAIADRMRRTPIFNALDTKRPKTRDLLIARGADIEYADASRGRPLKHAASVMDTASVVRLLEAGADPTAVDDLGTTFQSSLFRADPSFMHWQARRRYRKVIAILEERGIPLDPNAERYR